MDTDRDVERRWPRRGGPLALTKCGAGAVAGSVTGLLAGLGVAIALGKELDEAWLRLVLGALIVFVGAVGGLLTGAIASGCFSTEKR